MLSGQWWRAVTALTLHVDPAHLLGNAACGALFLCLLCRDTGVGLGFALCLAAGGLGNVIKVLVQGPGLHFLGASTAVFGALGALGGVRLFCRRGAVLAGRSAPVGAALMLLAMDLFDTWANNVPPGGNGEDPRLLIPLIHVFRPAFAVKEAKAAGDKECAKKLAEREQQVRRMQQQVKALETIHREIQEKKKGLTNY